MNDEIKEIREYISCPQFGDDHYGKWGALRLDQRRKIKDLLDYITNLQEENDYLKKHQRFHKKFGNDYIFCLEGDKETYKDLLLEKQEELENYKSRIDNAIKYIKEYCIDDEFYINLTNKEKHIIVVLNILNSDKE